MKEWDAVGREPVDCRGEDFVGDFLHKGVIYPRDGRVRAHAAGVVALVAVERALMVLAGGEDAHCLAVGEGEDGHFHAFDVVFDDDEVSRRSELLLFEHHAAGRYGVLVGFGQERAFARREAVGLDDEGGAAFFERRFAFGEVGAEVEVRGRDAVLLHEGLREGFASLEACAGGSRAYDEDARLAQRVCGARDERRFGADEYELYAEPGAELLHRLGIARIASVAERQLRYAGVAGAAVKFGRYLGF